MAELNDRSGGYRGVTDWNAVGVESIWRTLAQQQTDAQWTQVAGWRKTYELGLTHLGRLQTYRAGLAEAWPPEKNAASRTYLASLDDLIDNVRATCDAASANYTTLAAATSALESSRSQIKKIYDEYVAKRQTKATYDAQVASLADAGYAVVPHPPVTDAELEQLNTRARTVMFALSDELVQAQAQIRQPPNYPVKMIGDKNQPDVYGSASPPSIPPVIPVPTASQTHITPRSSSPVPQPSLSPGSAVPISIGAGPILGSAGAAAAPPMPPPTPPSLSPTPGPVVGLPGLLPPGVPLPPGGLGRTVSGSALPGGSLGEGGSGVSRIGAGGSTGSARSTPLNGVIGGTSTGRPVTGTPPARRINPIGGVIGGGGAGTAPGGPAGQRPVTAAGRPMVGGHVPPGASAGRPMGRHADDGAGRRWDPDNPWEVDEGVAPVVLPPNEPGPIDPGPAIGFDR